MAEMEVAVSSGTTPSQDGSQPASSSVQSASQEAVQAAKTFTQDEVAKLTGRIRDETRQEYYERGKRDALSTQVSTPNPQAQQSQSSMGGMVQLTPQQLEEMVERKITERSSSEAAKQRAYSFTNKLLAAKDKHPDFEETVAALNLPENLNIVKWADNLDNTADVIYDLGKNPAKYAHILMLNQTAPELAQRELSKLSSSIKDNDKAKSQSQSPKPLDQLTPSNAGTDNGKHTIRDLRKQSWLKV
jgi:hypothetical protein